MNKVGILTIHDANNYGSVLQAYATQQIFTNENTKGIIIDYKCPSIKNEYGLSLIRSKKTPIEKAKALLQVGIQYKSSIKFDAFKNNFFNLIPFDELCEDEFYTFIVGSDQVWNYKITDSDATYLLDFVKNSNKKNSFSSCFGIESLPQEVVPMYKNYLSSFRYLTVRDNNSKRLLYELTGKNVERILDPTMLLPTSLWLTMINTVCDYGNYILVYQIAHSQQLVSFAEHLSQKTGYRIISIKGSLRQRFNAKYIWDAGPQEFISLIYNASYVITNSFHGTVFSIIFNKQFYTGLLPKALEHVNSRLIDLLEQFQLEKRIIGKNDVIEENDRIDFTIMNNILEAGRVESKIVIDHILNYGD